MSEKNKGLTVSEAGKLGGNVVKKKYGKEFYEKIGRKGGKATAASQGPEFYHAIGKKGGRMGGEATREKYGSEFYEKIGRKGGQKVKSMMAAGEGLEYVRQAEMLIEQIQECDLQHRKGWKPSERSLRMMMNDLLDETSEMMKAENREQFIEELSDVFAVFLQVVRKDKLTLNRVAAVAVHKLALRFEGLEQEA